MVLIYQKPKSAFKTVEIGLLSHFIANYCLEAYHSRHIGINPNFYLDESTSRHYMVGGTFDLRYIGAKFLRRRSQNAHFYKDEATPLVNPSVLSSMDALCNSTYDTHV